ncbi:MAG: M28 family peptidase [Tropicimonas sp.]|uniref:M28 family peptidase n=1 Tax=Tropicimonas sp. TaxID=2067044 RepID=UPI003A8824E5
MQGKSGPDAVSIDAVMAHVNHMQAAYPYRKSGLGQDVEAGRYVVEQLRAAGLEAELEEFLAYDSDPGEAEVEVLGADGRALTALACAHIEPTPAGGQEAELIDVGGGGYAAYAGHDVRGKIVLAEVSYAPATPEKARIAAEMGAAGIVLMNWGRDDGDYIPARALKAVWGNPTSESWGQIPRLWGVSISRRDGIDLRRRLAAGPVRLRVRATARRDWRRLYQPVGWLRAPEGAAERDQFLIVSGHIDSWDPGVTDNITGNAVMMEIARTLAARRDELRRSVVFCFWNGHEVAEATGSTCFLDAHWEEIARGAVGYFNIDSIGMKGTEEFHINACPELAGFAGELAQGCFGDSLPCRTSNLRRVGDQSFFGAGVPAVTGRHMYSDAVIAAENGATLGWYNHTTFDTLEMLSPEILRQDLRWCADFVDRMLRMAILPHRFAPRIADMKARFAEVLGGEVLGQGTDPARLGVIAEMIDRLEPDILWLDRHLDRLARAANDLPPAGPAAANRLIRRLAQQLTFITGSASGRYRQDSYGISSLLEPVPRLAALARWRALDPDSTQAHLLETDLIRSRHEITDALGAAGDMIADFRASLGKEGA